MLLGVSLDFAVVGLHHLPLAAVGQVLPAVGLHHIPLAAVGQVLPAVGLHHVPLAAVGSCCTVVDINSKKGFQKQLFTYLISFILTVLNIFFKINFV